MSTTLFQQSVKARARSADVGADVGVLVGAVPLSPLSFVWPIPSSFGLATVLVGLGCGLLIGLVVGDSRARMYHRMAEQARAQLVLEERISQSDVRVEQLVAALTARARAVAPPTAAPLLRSPWLDTPDAATSPGAARTRRRAGARRRATALAARLGLTRLTELDAPGSEGAGTRRRTTRPCRTDCGGRTPRRIISTD